MNTLDQAICAMDEALRTLFAKPHASRPTPKPPNTLIAKDAAPSGLNPEEARHSAALMRVNHVGEICAQALYNSQRLATQSPNLQAHFKAASVEETDHLAWTQERIEQLDGHTSMLNPLWYAGAFTIGYAMGRLGKDPMSLGFVVETERQVEQHLSSHLELLPKKDLASRAIVAQMQKDEVHHAQEALRAGALELPGPIKGMMKIAAKVMTSVAHHI